MPLSIVDALILELKLDASGIKSGAQEIDAIMSATKAKLQREGSQLELLGKGVGFAVDMMASRLVKLFGLYLSFEGLKKLIVDTSELTASFAHFAQNVGISKEEMGAWTNALRNAGVGAEEFRSVIGRMTHDLALFVTRWNPTMTPWMENMALLGVRFWDQKPTESIKQFVTKIRERIADKRMTEQLGIEYLGSLGIDFGNFAQFLLHAPLDEALKKGAELGTPTDIDAKVAEQNQEIIGKLAARLDQFQRDAINNLFGIVKAADEIIEKLISIAGKVSTIWDGFEKFVKNLLRMFTSCDDDKDRKVGSVGGLGLDTSGALPGARGVRTESYGGGAYGKRGGGGIEPGKFTKESDEYGDEGVGTGSEYLRSQRARLAEEVSKDPELQREVAAIGTFEHESDPVAVFESLANRAIFAKKTIRQMIHSGFYGPVNAGLLPGRVQELARNPERMNKMLNAWGRMTRGSNLLEGATDQGSPTDPNANWPGGRIVRYGEVYNDWGGAGGHEASRRFREEQQAHVRGERERERIHIPVPVPPTGTGGKSPWVVGRWPGGLGAPDVGDLMQPSPPSYNFGVWQSPHLDNIPNAASSAAATAAAANDSQRPVEITHETTKHIGVINVHTPHHSPKKQWRDVMDAAKKGDPEFKGNQGDRDIDRPGASSSTGQTDKQYEDYLFDKAKGGYGFPPATSNK